MKKTLLSLLLSFCLSLNADLTKYDSFEKVHVEEITVTITNNSEPNSPVKEKVLTQIALKKGDLFNQS